MEQGLPSTESPAPVVLTRLPTLFECLSRRTQPPVDLFSFYIYMRDFQRSVDYLDFWLDVAQHMSLCRHYVRGLRRSVMIGTPDGDKAQSKRSSVLLETLGDMNHPVAGPSHLSSEKEKNQDAQMSAFLREQNNNNNGIGHSPSNSLGSHTSAARHAASHDQPRPSFMDSPLHNTDSNSPAREATRADIRASAEKILYTYLLPSAEREIIIPAQIVHEITIAIEQDGRDDPEVFDAAKDYVFQAMERDAFPGFLQMKALGNLIPPTEMLRVIFGLIAVFAGYWAGSVLCMTGASRERRAWITIPFTLGWYALITRQYSIDPILAFAGYSEYSLGSLAKIKEPYINKLLRKRALMCILVFLLFDAAHVLIFTLVPARHI
ncbi:RGS domain-containing protein [Bisporella sp. PMI_857]|nr:RGS domain-containing protein [Bisporella sp. PMI_857]